MTLAEVQAEFIHWRTNKVHRSVRIPESLWQKVHAIHTEYPNAQLTSTLRLSERRLTANMQRLSGSAFVNIPLPPDPVQASRCEVTLTCGKKSLSFSVPVQTLTQLLPAIAPLMQ